MKNQNLNEQPASANHGWLRRLVRPHGSIQNVIMVLMLVSLMANLVTVIELVKLEIRRDYQDERVNTLESQLSRLQSQLQPPQHKQ